MEFFLALGIVLVFVFTLRQATRIDGLTIDIRNLQERVRRLEESAQQPAAAYQSEAAQPDTVFHWPEEIPAAVEAEQRRPRARRPVGVIEPPRTATPEARTGDIIRETVPRAAPPPAQVPPPVPRQAPAHVLVPVPAVTRPPQPRKPSALEVWMRSLRRTDEWEALIGGRWLNRIGALALILGIGFFLKYAIDKDWINQTGRVVLGLAVGVGLLTLARVSYRRGYQIFAQGLVGAGIATLYLSVYASFNFYHLVPLAVALIGRGAITAAAFAQALWYDSLAVSILAWAGGFIAPLLLMTEESSELGLALYVAFLVAGILAIASRKTAWFILEPLTLAASWMVFLIWLGSSYTSSSLGLAVIFASLLWALFHGKDVYDIVRGQGDFHGAQQVIAVVNGIAFYGILCALLLPDNPMWLAVGSLILGAVYAATGLVAVRGREVQPGVKERYGLIPIVLLALATFFGVSGFELAMLWAVEALALLWLGIRSKTWYIWQPALALYGLAVTALMAYPQTWRWDPVGQFQVIANERVLAFVVLAASAAAAVAVVARLESVYRTQIQWALHSAWSILLFICFAVETNDAFSRTGSSRFMIITTLWAVYAAAVIATGTRLNIRVIWAHALAFYTLAVGLLLITPEAWAAPLASFQVIWNERALAFGVTAAVAAGIAVMAKTLEQKQRKPIQSALQYVWCALLLIGITVETNDFYGRDEYTRFMVLTMLWMAYSLPLAWYGLSARLAPVLTSALGAVALSIGMGLTMGASYQPIEDFTGLAVIGNVRAAALVVVVVGLLAHLELVHVYAKALPFARQAAIAIQSAIVVILFALITYETNDFYQNQIVATSGNEAVHLGYIRFLVLAAFWMLYSLPVAWYAIRRRIAPILVLGLSAALLATGLGLAVGASYQPIQALKWSVLNLRAFVMLLLIAGLVVHHIWLKRNRDVLPWAATVLVGLEALIVLTGFELVTAELNDAFRQMAGSASPQLSGLAATFAELMALVGIWTVYSVLLVWYGVRRAVRTVLIAGLISTSLAVGVGAFAGIGFAPSGALSLVLSLRLAILPLLLAGLFVEMQLLRSVEQGYRWLANVITAFQAVMVLLGFELVTGETWNFFQSKMTEVDAAGDLQNMQQLGVSIVWLLYASLLMAIGIWKRTRWLRLGALALFGITILKVFLYDLSFLETAYRSVSLAGLGVILLAVSFLYHRYKGVLLQP